MPIVANDILKLSFYTFSRKQGLAFHVNQLTSNDSHETFSLIFLEKKIRTCNMLLM